MKKKIAKGFLGNSNEKAILNIIKAKTSFFNINNYINQ